MKSNKVSHSENPDNKQTIVVILEVSRKSLHLDLATCLARSK